MEKSATSYIRSITLSISIYNSATHPRWIGNRLTPSRSRDKLSTKKISKQPSIISQSGGEISTDSGVRAAAEIMIDPRAVVN